MIKFKASFNGRKKGAIGVCYGIITTVYGVDKKQAELNLYGEYEHISNLLLLKQ